MKFLKIEGIVEMPDDCNTDDFIDAYIQFVESHGCSFGGGLYDISDLEKAYEHSTDHKETILQSQACGCFHCLKTFPPSEITRWLNEGSGTALCPYCGTDSVIGDGAGIPITKEFLIKMQHQWF